MPITRSSAGLQFSDPANKLKRLQKKFSLNEKKYLLQTAFRPCNQIQTKITKIMIFFRFIHGGGIRYQEGSSGADSLVSLCEKFVPKSEPAAYAIGPNYDMDMDMLSWLEDPKNLELEIVDIDENGQNIYEDRRTVQKYYKKHDGKYLKAFEPLY